MHIINLVKKLAFVGSIATVLLAPIQAFAQTPTPIPGINIIAPGVGFKSLTDFIGKAITIALGLAIIVVLVMLILGAFEWITSGGDKEAVGKARGRIINALIGLAILAIAFALARVAAQFVGFDISNITIPGPNTSAIPSGQF
ncbi:hypothetical protein A3I48_01600 [Candidatus Daviesbacteria bacterium RIFCSPLOWO2_02_FULL_36_7]|uniref:Uncharacterized protein n=1 Tax=Candidatus Daviesbacteria bacterium RIFCSPLOWO2_02_FULL_36_7 TaxID=1797792 RepID=A0A1F5MHG6_9BACT|nr:MAG: hypothetical protein A3I48_01600 [Candidatus Daviesbacteria bacterium RIFCSPLOWO2_02_FULL_36_7]